MPIVRAYVGTDPQSALVKAQTFDNFTDAVYRAVQEVVPSAFNSPEGPVAPGQIEFMAFSVSGKALKADVLVEVEAYDFPDRYKNIDRRCKEVKEGLKKIFTGKSFSVWGKLVKAGMAAGDTSVRDYRGDMSMEAAIKRAREAIDPAFTSDS